MKFIKKMKDILYAPAPGPVKSTLRSITIICLILTAAGLIFPFFSLHNLKQGLLAGLFLIMLAAGLWLYAFFMLRRAVMHGWIEIEGTCIQYQNIINVMSSKRKGGDAFILSTANQVLYIPANKRKDVPPLGCKVKVYVAADSKGYKGKNGYYHYSSIFGYELMPTVNDPEQSDEN